jgi:hypothetical protein
MLNTFVSSHIYTILAPDPGLTAVDTVLTHPCTATNIATHRSHVVQGAAAARRVKINAFRGYCVRGLTFFAFAIESYGLLDA